MVIDGMRAVLGLGVYVDVGVGVGLERRMRAGEGEEGRGEVRARLSTVRGLVGDRWGEVEEGVGAVLVSVVGVVVCAEAEAET